MVVTASLGLAGGGYAAWTTSLHVEGTVQTGSVDAIWDMQEDNQFVGIFNPATGQIVDSPVPPEKDIARCLSDLEQQGGTARVVRFQVVNAYPSYTCEIIMGGIVDGSIPVHVSRIERMAADQFGNNVIGTELNLDVRLTRKVQIPDTSPPQFQCDDQQPIGISTQLHRGDRFCAIIRIHANQIAKQNHLYTGGVWIDLIQWNLAGEPVPPGLRQRVAQVLGGDVIRFDIVDINPQIIAILIGLLQGETAQIQLPVAQPDSSGKPGPIMTSVAASRFLMRPDITLATTKFLEQENVFRSVGVALPAEQNFRLGEGGCEPPPPDTQDTQLTPPALCGALSIIDDKNAMVSGMIWMPESDEGDPGRLMLDVFSFFEPVDQILGTPGENPGMHVVYTSEDTVNPFTDDEEPGLPPPQEPIGRNTLLGRVAGMASPDSQFIFPLYRVFNTKIVLDGSKEFYAQNPATVWSRMDAIHNVTDWMYTVVEPWSFDWKLNLAIKGMEVWVSGGPNSTDSVGLTNQLTAPGYFLINSVTNDEIHHFFVGYNVVGVYGRAAGIPNSSSTVIGGGAGLNHAYSEALTSQSLKTKVVVQAHEVGHLIGGTHGAGAQPSSGECAGGIWSFLSPGVYCAPSIMPAGSAGAPDTRRYFFSNANDANIIGALDSILP